MQYENIRTLWELKSFLKFVHIKKWGNNLMEFVFYTG